MLSNDSASGRGRFVRRGKNVSPSFGNGILCPSWQDSGVLVAVPQTICLSLIDIGRTKPYGIRATALGASGKDLLDDTLVRHLPDRIHQPGLCQANA